MKEGKKGRIKLDESKVMQAFAEEQIRFDVIKVQEKTFITEKATGNTGQVYFNKGQYSVLITHQAKPMDDRRRDGLAKRMCDWYVYTQLKK